MEFDYKNPPKDECPNVMCGKKKDDCCGITKVVLAAVLGDDSEDSKVAPFNGAYCNKIVEYEANGAIYFYSSDGIYTKLGNKLKSEEAASVEYVDQQARYALNQAKSYTDTEIDVAAASMTTYVDGGDAATLADAKNYADAKDATVLDAAEDYTDSEVATALQSAKDYADTKDADTLQAAKDYTDSAASGVVTKNYVDTGDQNTLDAAKNYTDSKDTIIETNIEALENSLSTVATSGSYDDLSDQPVIPQWTLTNVDPGEGVPLEENHFIGVYN